MSEELKDTVADLKNLLTELRELPTKAHGKRPVYVYSLEVEYPTESLRRGWAPPGWVNDGEYTHFQWPRLRVFLSKSGADHLAARLRDYGATVTVLRSEPVVWR